MVDRIYLTDKEIAPLVGLPEKEWVITAQVLERKGLPRRNPLFGNKRCWPAVQEFLIERERPKSKLPGEDDGYRGFKATSRPSNRY